MAADPAFKFAVLMATYCGGRFLERQLASIAAQTSPHWTLWVSDDDSTDGTLDILQRHGSMWGEQRMTIVKGPHRGYSANFLSLICNPRIQADYYAFADQDDIWESDKLARAASWLSTVPGDRPALYCSRTRLVDDNGNHLGMSPLFTKQASFANALVQNIASGNTIVLNECARRLLAEAGCTVEVVSHDWWAYLTVTGCGGVVLYDRYPTVQYRQHGANLIGGNSGWSARAARLGMMWRGRFRSWNEINVKALARLRSRLTPDSRTTFELFCSARRQSLIGRLRSMRKAGVRRQTALGNLALIAATVLNKM
jgi:glycosyltransferase involved in cell wall biosynthesis